MSEAPPFWFKKPGVAAYLLSPFGKIYGSIAGKRMKAEHAYAASVPVLCVGNFVTGGAGKTPTAIAIAKTVRTMNMRPGFLSRGYGGSVSSPTVVDSNVHNSKDVGDEPLILCDYATTVVSPDRVAGAKLLEEQGVDFIIMDDGFQNPSLLKDYSLAVVDSRRGIGNGFCIPAGPVRADMRVQLSVANAVLVIGKLTAGLELIREAAKMAKPVLTAEIQGVGSDALEGVHVLAYSGIADPEKFHTSLEDAGAIVTTFRNFHDHHQYTAQECRELLEQARDEKLVPVTTSKDAARLRGMGREQDSLRSVSKVLNIQIAFENPNMLEIVINSTIKNAETRRIKSAG